MTEEGSSGLKIVLKLPQMFYISTIASMVSTLVLLLICACRSFRQNIFEQFSCVASDEESNNSNSTEDISIRDPSEKDLFVSDIVKRVWDFIFCHKWRQVKQEWSYFEPKAPCSSLSEQ